MKNTLRFTFALLAAGAAFAGSKDKTLDIYWIDSEGGGSTLIVTPNDESVLIDTGNPGARDPGRIAAAAKAAGLTKLDHVLITHWHIDHFGGAAEVAQALPFGAIYQRAIPEGDPDGRPSSPFPTQIKPFRELAAKRVMLAPGVTVPLRAVKGGPQLELKCLAADKKVLEPTAAQKAAPKLSPGAEKAVPPSDNDNSAAFVLTFGGFRFFDGGDLTWNYEARLVAPHNVVGPVDVYQTDHHGLDVSNNPVLIQRLAPTVVVMNNGPRKGGTQAAFDAIRSAQGIAAVYQLHKSMNVDAAVNYPDSFIANLEEAKPAEKCPANIIKLSVAPDGKSYTVSIPANGSAKTYKTKG